MAAMTTGQDHSKPPAFAPPSQRKPPVAVGVVATVCWGVGLGVLVVLVIVEVLSAVSPGNSSTPYPYTERMWELQTRNHVVISVTETWGVIELSDVLAAGAVTLALAGAVLGIVARRGAMGKMAIIAAPLVAAAAIGFHWGLNYFAKSVIEIPF